MKTFKALFATLVLISASSVFASDSFPPSTLTLTVVNHSSEAISFTGFNAGRPGNHITAPARVASGATAVITGTSTQGNDLSGVITSNNVPSGFILLDYNFSHTGQSVFLGNTKFRTNVLSKTINADRKNPRGLFYTDVTVEIADKN